MQKKQIKKGLDTIATVDRDIAKALKQHGYPEARIRPAGFETFLATIISQQISVKASASIRARVHALLPSIDAKTLLTLTDSELRAAGLSQRKMEYLQNLARAITDGSFSPEALHDMTDAAAIQAITQLRGFGQWSAEIYLMFSLGRPNIFPADDLILQTSLQKIKKLKTRPTPKIAREQVAHWAPWRSAGSLFLWHYHHNDLETKK